MQAFLLLSINFDIIYTNTSNIPTLKVFNRVIITVIYEKLTSNAAILYSIDTTRVLI